MARHSVLTSSGEKPAVADCRRTWRALVAPELLNSAPAGAPRCNPSSRVIIGNVPGVYVSYPFCAQK